MEDNKLKAVLSEIVRDLVDLRANQGLLGLRVGTGVTKYDADDAKTAALKETEKSYAKLLEKIESL